MNLHENINVKCESLNVRGLNKSIKRRSIFRWVHNQNNHFTFLQETYSSKECANIWEAEWGGRIFFSHGSTHSKGVMTLINPKLDFKLEKMISDKNGRYIILDVIVDETHLILVNIYAPNDLNQQLVFFKDLHDRLQEFAQENIIIAGDFNCALADKDKKGGNPVSKKTPVIKEIERIMHVYNLTDIWRNLNPNTECFTWRNKALKIQCRLDYFLISNDLNSLVTSCTILNSPETDHSAITLHLKSEDLKQDRGPGFWKFNNSLLQDSEYVTILQENIEDYKEKYSAIEDLGLKWDLIKMEIRGFTIKYSKMKAKKRENEEMALKKKAEKLLLESGKNPDKRILNELYATNLRLQNIMHHKTKGAILRSKARWHEHGERNTRYFFNLEKRNHCRKTVTKLKLGENKYTKNQFEILQEEKRFYESLYKSQNIDNSIFLASTFFNPENVSPLSQEEKESCEGLLSENECFNAIKEFKNNKSPGTDGFTAEFYKFFWPELKTEMTSSFNYAFQNGSLSISQRRGIISLIPKKNKDKTLLENLRPISLLNVDYKILTKAIAKRLEKVLPSIINPDQTGYVKGRYIGENIRLIQDLMFYTKMLDKPGVAIFLDFRKAFDTIEWNYINAALKFFNFGPDLLNWFTVLYNQVSSCVLNNGHASEFFLLQRGVRQGCPLSGLLFVIGIELFARALKNDHTIKGIEVEQKEIKVTQYADDTTVFVRDRESVTQLLKLLEEFKVNCGLEINTTKTEALWLGSWRNNKETPYNFKWPREPVHALGVHFSYDEQQANKLNFEEKARNLETILNAWRRRNLTLIGRIKIVKTLGVAKLIYGTSVLSIPEHFAERVNKLIFNFIWEGKTAKIKKRTIIAEKNYGGLKMLDFEIMEKALKIAWIKRIHEQSDASWKTIPEQATSHYGGLSFLTKCRYDTKLLDLRKLPVFYHSVLKYWQEYKHLTSFEEKNPENEIIWNNSSILVDQKPIFYSAWFKKEIIHVKDLLNENRDFLSLADFKQKFKVNNPFTMYYGLIRAIPISWKMSIRNSSRSTQSSPSETTPSTTAISTRGAYNAILARRSATPTNETKILKYGFNTENIHNIYLLPFRVTTEAKLIAFQFKIIHNILPTRVSLLRAGLVDDDICPICNSERQSLVHMFYSCRESSIFWEQFTQWWSEKFLEKITLSEGTILFGWHQNTSNERELNYILLIAKYHIFATCICEDRLSFDRFLLRLKSKLEVLRKVAIANKTLHKYNATWAPIL